MNAPGVDALHLVQTLRNELPTALRSGMVSGAEGWSLREVLTEHLFEQAMVTLVFTREGHSLRVHLFPTHALAQPYARIRHCDLYHRDDMVPGHEPFAAALLDGLLHWLDHTLAAVRDVSFLDPEAPMAPVVPPETLSLLTALREQLPSLLAMEPLTGWSLAHVGAERFQRLYVPRIDLTGEGKGALRLFLLPRGTEENCHFRTARFDMVYDDDAHGSVYTRHHGVMEHIAAWLDAHFPVTAPSALPSTPEASLARSVAQRLSDALRAGSLPELSGWVVADALAERFRGHDVSTLRLNHDGQTLSLRLLPTGGEPSAVFRTNRFDLVYDDDDRGTTFTRDHVALEAFTRWLGATFPSDEKSPPTPRRRRPEASDEATRRAEALAATLDEALRRSLDAGELPTLATWSFEGVALESFREDDVPTACFSKDGETLRIRILPTHADSGAHFRTERFDLLYDDTDNALFVRHHALLEHFTRWLEATFPLGESEHAQEFARRRALRARQLRASDEMVSLADTLDTELRVALASGALPLPDGWRFEGALVDQQQGVTAPAVRFTHGHRTLVLRVLPTDPSRTVFHRTSRFDVLYDSEPGDWQLQDDPVVRGFVAWLANTFPSGTAPPSTSDVNVPG